ncbi:MAG: zinc ribbon domain-containing protein [Promethearchaeota archaeon]
MSDSSMSDSELGARIALRVLLTLALVSLVVLALGLAGLPWFIIGGIAMVAILVLAASYRFQFSVEPIIEPTTGSTLEEEDTLEESKIETTDQLVPSEISCSKCGYKNPSDAQFCIRCGRDLEGSL